MSGTKHTSKAWFTVSKMIWGILSTLETSPNSLPHWYQEFCKTPIIFHVSHHAAAVHADLLVGEAKWSGSLEILAHKTKAIRMVNEQLSRLSYLDHETLEQLIFAVATLSRHELEPKHLGTEEVLLFAPHMPLANGMKPLGRFRATPQARAVLVQLINSLGGLGSLRIPGLANILAVYVLLPPYTLLMRSNA